MAKNIVKGFKVMDLTVCEGVDVLQGEYTNKGKSGPRLVIAIDFGTFASGWALQWRSDFDSNRLKIFCHPRGTSFGFCTYKVPTCLLLKPDKSVAKFGYDAEKHYHNLKLKNENPENWFFFRNFKMMLYHRESVDDDTPVEAAHGKHLPAIDVFSKSIKFMKDDVLGYLEQCGVPYPESSTKWVLTVPAIWNDQAKMVMRRAAEKAGIIKENLAIALEPECAAIYCSQLQGNQLEILKDKGTEIRRVTCPGSTTMVVDMGGGTIDITTMQFNQDSTMKQVHISGGGPWGGTRVDEKFMMFLQDLVGAEVLSNFVETNPRAEYDIRTDFEFIKRELKHISEEDSDDPLGLKLPQSLRELWEEKEDMKLADILKRRGREDNKFQGIQFSDGRLFFPHGVIREFFQETIGGILEYIGSAVRTLEQKELTIDAIILVGGFAASKCVVKSLREGLKDRRIPIVRPLNTELAVLNGAVLFGHDEKIITSRIMPVTYGVAMMMEYDETKHDISERFESRGKYFANNVFRKHVTKGESVSCEEWMANKEYEPSDDQQKTAEVMIFTSDKTNPIHITEEGCKFIGQIVVEFPETQLSVGKNKGPQSRRAVEVAFKFSDTEVKVKVVSQALGKTNVKSFPLT